MMKVKFNEREARTIPCELSIREVAPDAEGNAGESRTITGKAIVFNQESQVLTEDGMQFTEIIEPSACTAEFVANSDIKLNLLHERNNTIARCNKGAGNMKVEVREDGVYFEFEAPKCDLGDRALEMVRNGVYSGCSFEFFPGDYLIDELPGNNIRIRHTKFAYLDALTLGMDPAYTQTTVNAREILAGIPSKQNESIKESEENERLDREAFHREVQKLRQRIY